MRAHPLRVRLASVACQVATLSAGWRATRGSTLQSTAPSRRRLQRQRRSPLSARQRTVDRPIHFQGRARGPTAAPRGSRQEAGARHRRPPHSPPANRNGTCAHPHRPARLEVRTWYGKCTRRSDAGVLGPSPRQALAALRPQHPAGARRSEVCGTKDRQGGRHGSHSVLQRGGRGGVVLRVPHRRVLPSARRRHTVPGR